MVLIGSGEESGLREGIWPGAEQIASVVCNCVYVAVVSRSCRCGPHVAIENTRYFLSLDNRPRTQEAPILRGFLTCSRADENISLRCSASTRASVVLAPPAGNSTIIVSGREG